MPSPRKRIGFLPSEEVHEIIEKLCTANEFSQSKVTGLLVEEALRSRGVLNESYGQNQNDKTLGEPPLKISGENHPKFEFFKVFRNDVLKCFCVVFECF